MTCSKPYTITVATGITFSWGPATITPSTSGAASFTPDNADGNTAVAFVSIPAFEVDFSQVINTANVTINTTAVVPCNLHIDLVSVGVPPDPDMTWAITITDGGVLVNESSLTLGLNGSFDVPFNMPNTGGVNVVVSWFVTATILPLPVAAGSISLTAIFTVL